MIPTQAGDVCELGAPNAASAGAADAALEVPAAWRPACNPSARGAGSADGNGAAGGMHLWRVRMLPGPQAAPDYFTERDMEVLPRD